MFWFVNDIVENICNIAKHECNVYSVAIEGKPKKSGNNFQKTKGQNFMPFGSELFSQTSIDNF